MLKSGKKVLLYSPLYSGGEGLFITEDRIWGEDRFGIVVIIFVSVTIFALK